jgi:putative ABC transport system substrate-binding protein
MKARRDLLVALGLGVLSSGLPAFAQQHRVWRIGILALRSRPSSPGDAYDAFPQGMSDMGYVEGRDYVFDWVYADGNYDRLPGLAAELVQRKVDVIVTTSAVGAQAAQRITRTIPIVSAVTVDPVRDGLAASLARPGGNVTGLSPSVIDVSPKVLELMTIAVPKLSRVGVLVNPTSPTHASIHDALQSAALKLDLKLRPVEARSPEDFEPGLATLRREGVQAVIILPDAFFFLHRQRLVDQAAKSRLPSMYYNQEYVEAGGLMSYGENLAEFYRRSAALVDKILKGAKPGDLPFAQPTRFFLVINRKTANAIGLAFPQELLLRADRVIE